MNVIRKTEVAIVALSYWLKGNGDILRNPHGVPCTTIRFRLEKSGMDKISLDTFVNTTRKTIDLSGSKKKVLTEELNFRYYNFFGDNNERIDTKKHVTYRKNGMLVAEKGKIDTNILRKRNLKPLHKKKYSRTEYGLDTSLMHLGCVSEKKVVIRESFAEREYQKYKEKTTEEPLERYANYGLFTSFKNLWHNLKQC